MGGGLQRTHWSRLATVANAATTSSRVNIEGASVVGVKFPAAFTGTAFAVHGAMTDTDALVPLYDEEGAAITLTIAASRGYTLPSAVAAWGYLAFVVDAQAAARDLYVSLKG